MNSTRIRCHINAGRASVYRALLDARAIAKWKVPDGMTCHVHAFDAREGGSFRISLTYKKIKCVFARPGPDWYAKFPG
jgi:uncharacterized protein YndB with AHSA1/START domain